MTRNPCRAGDTQVIGTWIAGQARNDRPAVPRLSCRTRSGIHAAPEQTPPAKAACANCPSQSGHVAWDGCFCGHAGCTSSRRRIASCVRHLACESCLNAATKERREFSRRAAGTASPGSPMAPQGAEGDMTARSSPPMCGFAASPLCQRRRLNQTYSGQQWASTRHPWQPEAIAGCAGKPRTPQWMPGQARHDIFPDAAPSSWRFTKPV